MSYGHFAMDVRKRWPSGCKLENFTTIATYSNGQTTGNFSFDVIPSVALASPVPEPNSLALVLVATGWVCLLAFRRRRQVAGIPAGRSKRHLSTTTPRIINIVSAGSGTAEAGTSIVNAGAFPLESNNWRVSM
jgi:hypothetical protein